MQTDQSLAGRMLHAVVETAGYLKIWLSDGTSLIVWQTAAALAALFVAVLATEVLNGRPAKVRYLQGPFRTDLLYTALVICGIYGSIQQPVITWIDSIFRRYASFLYLNVLAHWPSWVGLIIFLLAIDFCRYWKHRWLHSFGLLRAFHTIHHGAANLNLLSAYRIHLGEYIFDGIITLAPVVLLGLPAKIWLPLYLLLAVHSAFVHSDLDISFGWFDRVLVSPRFHAAHHSADCREYDANFGALFSFWDIVFGTANFLPSRPRQYGLPQVPMPPSFLGQVLFPAGLIAHSIRAKLALRTPAAIGESGPSALADSKKR